ncbi:MAG: hypothetical protein KAS77_10405 [Thermoplasmata archaeon]|nr:hypothetical protein [Thermoplasmata archaeon]
MEVGEISLSRVTLSLALILLLSLAASSMVSLGEDVQVPVVPGDGDGEGGTSGDPAVGGSDGSDDGGDTADGTSSDGSVSSGIGFPIDFDAGSVPGTSASVPLEPGDASGGGATANPVETLPPTGDDSFEPLTGNDPLIILLVLVVFGAVGLYAPGEVRRMRIESAFRESLDARLALAQGEFVVALAGFDRAIDQAHPAYTQRKHVSRPVEWTLMPDGFYISLWRGRASALSGMGRKKAATATMRLADELEIVVGNGH